MLLKSATGRETLPTLICLPFHRGTGSSDFSCGIQPSKADKTDTREMGHQQPWNLAWEARNKEDELDWLSRIVNDDTGRPEEEGTREARRAGQGVKGRRTGRYAGVGVGAQEAGWCPLDEAGG